MTISLSKVRFTYNDKFHYCSDKWHYCYDKCHCCNDKFRLTSKKVRENWVVLSVVHLFHLYKIEKQSSFTNIPYLHPSLLIIFFFNVRFYILRYPHKIFKWNRGHLFYDIVRHIVVFEVSNWFPVILQTNFLSSCYSCLPYFYLPTNLWFNIFTNEDEIHIN